MTYILRVPHNEDARYDRYTLSVFCQHCGNHLATITGIECERAPKVRAELRELAQSYADATQREVEVTFRVTQERGVWFMPEDTA